MAGLLAQVRRDSDDVRKESSLSPRLIAKTRRWILDSTHEATTEQEFLRAPISVLCSFENRGKEGEEKVWVKLAKNGSEFIGPRGAITWNTTNDPNDLRNPFAKRMINGSDVIHRDDRRSLRFRPGRLLRSLLSLKFSALRKQNC